MSVHRAIRILCVLAAGFAPLLASFIARFISEVAVNHAIPRSENESLPVLTQTWVVGVADGKVPTVPVAAALSFVLVGVGLYATLSKKMSPETSGTVALLVCCMAYTVAVIVIGNTLAGTVFAFVPVREH